MLMRSLGIPIVGTGEEAAITNPSEENTVNITDTTTSTSSPFLKLPRELRNRIYHHYFEDFEEQMSRRFHYNKSEMSPNFLALMHTNRMLRSEASSIFYREFVPFEQIPFAYQRETLDVVVDHIHALFTLLAIRDRNPRITGLCSLNENGCISDNECWEAVFSARTLPAFIADETGEAVVSKAFGDRPEEGEEPEEDYIGCGTCGVEGCYEAQIGNDFFMKHRGHGPLKPSTDGCFLYLEGPLARLNWDRVFYRV
ncbi:hypothetical protein MBLNU13_g07789t1 [Cladosporium sp. NU13]